MKRYKLKLTIEERRAIFFALRSYLQNVPELLPAHNYAEGNARAVALMAAETFGKLDFQHQSEAVKPISLTPARWCAIYCALDLAYHGSDNESVRALLRQLFAKIYPIINRSLYE